MSQQIAYHRKYEIPNVKKCPACGGEMRDIADVQAYEGFGPRTYRFQKCDDCSYREFDPPDQRG